MYGRSSCLEYDLHGPLQLSGRLDRIRRWTCRMKGSVQHAPTLTPSCPSRAALGSYLTSHASTTTLPLAARGQVKVVELRRRPWECSRISRFLAREWRRSWSSPCSTCPAPILPGVGAHRMRHSSSPGTCLTVLDLPSMNVEGIVHFAPFPSRRDSFAIHDAVNVRHAKHLVMFGHRPCSEDHGPWTAV